MTKEQLAPLVEQRRISIRRVQDAVAKEFHLTRAELLSRSRGQRIAYARHIAMFLSRELAGQTAGLAHEPGRGPNLEYHFPVSPWRSVAITSVSSTRAKQSSAGVSSTPGWRVCCAV